MIVFVDALPESLEGGVRVGPYSTARPGALLRVVPNVGRFLARDGTTIEVFAEPGADPAAVDALTHGGVYGALIHQRGELPLHASTLVSPDRTRAVAIAGDSGAGKSTTAFELIRRGWMMLSDDLTRVTIEDGRAIAHPGRATVRLMRDACDAFALDVDSLQPAPNWPDKFIANVDRWNEPVALSALFALKRSAEPFKVTAATGIAAITLLASQTYRLHYVAALGCTKSHLQLITAMASSTRVMSIRGNATVSEIAGVIQSVYCDR